MKSLILIVLLVSVAWTRKGYASCNQFIEAMYDAVSHGDFGELPLPSIMYSGITTNNPGQKYECEHKSDVPYNYYLVDWINETGGVETNSFTGLCVPKECGKQDIRQGLQPYAKQVNVYDYVNEPTDGLMVVCAVFVGLWVTVLVVWSIITSCRQPVENEMIKKNEEVIAPSDTEKQQAVNSLITEERHIEPHQDFKLFNFYEGYSRIFKRSTQKNNALSSVFFLATFSLLFSIEFSYRQVIAANELKAMRWFDSFGGLLFCNVQIAFSVIMLILGMKLAYSLCKLSSFHEIGRYFFDQLLTKWGILVLTSMAAYLLLSWTDQPLNQLWRQDYGVDCPAVIYQMWFLFRTLTLDCKACLQWFWILEVDILLTIVSAPFFIIFRSSRKLGYVLYPLIIFVSLFVAYAILDSQNILYEPYRLFNMHKQFTINYQTNALVRMAPYFMGVLFGLFVNEGLDKSDSESVTNQNKWARSIRRNAKIQTALHVFGLSLMIAMYLQIIPYLAMVEEGQTRKSAYAYVVFAPFGFLIGLIAFILPCLWQGESKLTVLINKVLSLGAWSSLQRMSVGFLLIGPIVMGFTTYSMQNSIYFNFQTVLVYFLGDIVIIYILTLLAVSSIDNQLLNSSKWIQTKVFGNQTKYSVLVIED